MNQCDNGHFYDEARFESCPYCKENTGIGKTMAAADIGKTVAAFPGNPAAAAATAFDSGKTVAVMKKKIGIDPAVGFLICIEGPHRGTQPMRARELHGTRNKRRVPDVHSVKAPERDRESPLRNRRGHKWRADAVTVRETFTLRFP